MTKRFDELSLGDYFIHGGCFYEKTDDSTAKHVAEARTCGGWRGYERVQHELLHVEETWRHHWQAVTDNYDGPGSPIGSGATAHEAIAELAEAIEIAEDK